MRFFRGLAMLMAAVLILTGISAAFAEEEKIYTLPVDMSGGMPYQDSSFNKENPFKWSDDHHHYEDPTIVADYYKLNGKEYGTAHLHYVEITIKHGSQLRTACADPNTFDTTLMRPGKNIAARVNAVVAVDGDFCNSYYAQEGNKFCLRQGTVYRDTVVDYLDMLLIDEDGDFHIYKGGPELADLPKEEIDGKKINNAFQFGPAIVIDGDYEDTIHVSFDYGAGFEQIARHIIEDHHAKHPHMMAGLPNNVFSDERIKIFRLCNSLPRRRLICEIKLGYIVQLGRLYFLWYFDPRFLLPYQRIELCDGISIRIRCFFLSTLGYNLILPANSSLEHSGKELQFFSRIVYFQKSLLCRLADIFTIRDQAYHRLIHFVFGSFI